MRKSGQIIYLIAMLCIGKSSLAQDSTFTPQKKVSAIKYNDYAEKRKFEDSIKRELDELFAPRKSYFKAGLDYLSNNVFMGRKDTVTTPYVIASLDYCHKSGLHIEVAASYLPNSDPGRFDLFTMEGGYKFRTGAFEGELLADKYFFSSLSNNVKADIKETFAFSGTYDFAFLKSIVNPTFIVSDKYDFMLLLGVEHSFYFDEDAFDLTPTININGSTENYYSSYYKNRKFRVKKKKVVITESGKISGVVENASQFKILDYEFTLPITYTTHKLVFSFNPTYAIPVNPAIVDITTQIANNAPHTKMKTEFISNSFFWEAGLAYSF